ncbi:DUF1993 family protein [Polyangium aurulentum]|nr:DUF1993 family protein [Polyangium aurulentum]
MSPKRRRARARRGTASRSRRWTRASAAWGSSATRGTRLDATIAYLRAVAPSELEAGLDRTIVIENRRGSASFTGDQFLLEFAIPTSDTRTPRLAYESAACMPALRGKGGDSSRSVAMPSTPDETTSGRPVPSSAAASVSSARASTPADSMNLDGS